MTVTIDKAVFQKDFHSVSSILKTRTTLPVLGSVKLKSVGTAVTLTATDLDCFFTAAVLGEPSIEGECLLPARLVKEWLAGAGDGSLQISAPSSGRIRLQVDRNKIELSTISPEDFPPLPSDEFRQIAEADFAPLQKLAIALPDDDSRLELYDVPVSYQSEEKLVAHAMRASFIGTIELDGKCSQKSKVHLIPPHLPHIARMGRCTVFAGGSFQKFASESGSFYSKQLSVQTIDLARAIQGWKFTATADCLREELICAITSCHVLRGLESNARAELSYDNGALAVSCVTDTGESSHQIDAKISGPFPTTMLPTDDLLAALHASESEVVEFGFTDPTLANRLKIGPATYYFAAYKANPKRGATP